MTEARIEQVVAPALSGAERAARRKRIVTALQIALLVVVLGAWELCARTGIVDPFFFGMPSQIVEQIRTWIAEGTSLGPLWVQVLVTLEETVLGFAIGAILGVICGVALGRNQLLADVFGVYIKVANSIPRVVLGSIFVIALGLGMPSKVALAAESLITLVENRLLKWRPNQGPETGF